MRDLTRTRSTLIQERSRVIARLQKNLEDANIKLASVASDVMGASAQHMLHALMQGDLSPSAMAEFARGKMRAKRGQLAQALTGHLQPHHGFLIAEHLSHIDGLEEAIDRLSAEIAERLRPYEAILLRLQTIPGIKRRLAEVIPAEIGPDMSRFPSAQRLASWAGMCPGNCESAGKRLSGKTRKGSQWLRTALIEAAHAALHAKGSYLSTHYHHMAAHRGKKRAAVALGHTLLVIIYHMLSEEKAYEELGGDSLDHVDRQGKEKRLVRQLEKLGFEVSLHPTSCCLNFESSSCFLASAHSSSEVSRTTLARRSYAFFLSFDAPLFQGRILTYCHLTVFRPILEEVKEKANNCKNARWNREPEAQKCEAAQFVATTSLQYTTSTHTGC